MDRRLKSVLALAAVLAVATAAAPAEARNPYAKGTTLRFSGRVTDPQGGPLAGATVVLETARVELRLLRWRRERVGTLQVPTTVAADGRYVLDWPWDPYYNTFDLVVAVPVQRGGRETFQEYHRTDVTERVMTGGSLAVDLVVEDARGVRFLQGFLAGLDHEDETRVYTEMGLPDRIDPGRSDYDPDSSWWYFAAGKVYRFEDGRLDRVETFTPVP